MSKVLYGILNWKRRIGSIRKIKKKLPGDIVVCTDDPSFWKRTETIEAVPSVAASKNLILKQAITGNYDYCFIIEDDLIPRNSNVFFKYMMLMNYSATDVIMYGFGSGMSNRVLDGKPNPILRIDDNRGNKIILNRKTCSACMGFRVNRDMIMFDERLDVMETDLLMHDHVKAGKYPTGYGFWFDLDESWTQFRQLKEGQNPFPSLRKRTQEAINKDVSVRGNDLPTAASNADAVINYVKERRDV
jgi:hypothetical protein